MYGKQEIEDYEALINLYSRKASDFLGCKYTTYSEYKNNRRPEDKLRPAPDHVLYNIQALTMLRDSQRNKLKKERALLDIDKLEISQEIMQVFEDHLGLGATYCAQFLGRKYTTYSEYKNGRQIIPVHIAFSIEAHMLLSRSQLRELITERLDFDKLTKLGFKRIKAIEKYIKRMPKYSFRVLIGCSKEDYISYKNREEVLPNRLSDCIDGLMQLPADDLKAIIKGRIDCDCDCETIPLATDLTVFMDAHDVSAAQLCQFLSCEDSDLKRYVGSSSDLPSDIAALLYVLLLLPEEVITEMKDYYVLSLPDYP
jgi:hypothetical protein